VPDTTTLWRLATTDDQRWHLEMLAEAIQGVDYTLEWLQLRDTAIEEASRAIEEAFRDWLAKK
jgi:hypothetical protein